jgi:hypothetical protein
VPTTVALDDDGYQAAMHLCRTSGERLGKVLSMLAHPGRTKTQGIAGAPLIPPFPDVGRARERAGDSGFPDPAADQSRRPLLIRSCST